MKFAEIEIIKYLSGLAADQNQDQINIFYCFVPHISNYKKDKSSSHIFQSITFYIRFTMNNYSVPDKTKKE